MKENLITQSNELLNASYSLTLNERRLLLACISQIDGRKEFDSTTPIKLSVEDANTLFFNEQSAVDTFRQMVQAAKSLQSRLVKLFWDDNDKELNTYFVQTIQISHRKREINLYFAIGILPYLTQLKSNFTSYKLMNISRLTSVHAMRVYELIVQWSCQTSSAHYKEIGISEFKLLLGIEGKYGQLSAFRKFVVDICEKQINESTDFDLDIKLKKYTSSFEYIQFFYNKKPDKKLVQAAVESASKPPRGEKQSRDQDTPDLFHGMTDKQRAVFGAKLAHHPDMAKFSNGGEEYPAFAERLAVQLADTAYLEKYMPILLELGFKRQ